MSAQKLNEITNCGYVSSEETDSLLVSNPPKHKPTVLRQLKNSVNGPTSNMTSTSSSSKPTLIRQDRTSTYLTSPQLSQQTRIGSDDSMRGVVAEDDIEQGLQGLRVPDIEVYEEDQEEMQQRLISANQQQQQQQLQQNPTISVTNLQNYQANMETNSTNANHPSLGTSSYQNLASSVPPSGQSRCRACRNCSRRASTTPVSMTTAQMDSGSRDSVKSAFQPMNLSCSTSHNIQQNVPVLVTSSPTNGSRIIRQSSQPESSTSACGAHSTCGHSHTVPNVSLKQLRDNTTDGIAGIAADSLRINGGMRPFKQVS